MEVLISRENESVHLEKAEIVSEEDDQFTEVERADATGKRKFAKSISKITDQQEETGVVKASAYECKFCRVILRSSQQYKAHMKCHIRYRCCECQLLFVSMKTLTRHASIHSGAAGAWKALPHMCPTCGKIFSVPSHLRVHELIHRKDKQFMCEFCSFESATESNLKKHLRRHSDEKPFECDLCKKTFKVLGNLRVHMERHIRERNYLCIICGKSYITKSNLNGHMLTHCDEKKHVCLQCVPNRKFARSTDLGRHHRAFHTFTSVPFDFYK